MPPIPTTLLQYGPAGLTLVATAALAWPSRVRPWMRPGVSLACLFGWAALEPLGRWHAAVLTPGLAPAMLLVPAAGIVVLEGLRAWRAGRNDKLISFAAAAVAGWWLARVAAAPHEAWRVGIVVAALAGLIAFILRQQPGRGVALALTLWGGLAASAPSLPGWPIGWVVAASVLAAGWVALLALGASATVPSALVAAVLAGADLVGGQLPRGRLGAVDLVCLLALVAPFGVDLAAARLGKRWRPLAPVLAAAIAVALAATLAWSLRRLVAG